MLATDVGGMKEAIIPNQTGHLVKPNDVDALRSGIEEMLRDPERLRRMGARGRKLVEDNFTKNMMIEKTSRILTSSFDDR